MNERVNQPLRTQITYHIEWQEFIKIRGTIQLYGIFKTFYKIASLLARLSSQQTLPSNMCNGAVNFFWTQSMAPS